MINIYFLRHGAVYNPQNIIYGTLDYHLSVHGIFIIKKASEILKKQGIQVMYSSPLYRCIETSNIVANKLGIVYVIDNNLTESEQLAQWEGLRVADIKKNDSDNWYQFCNNPSQFKPNGVSLKKISERMFKVVTKLLNRYEQQNILCVSHGDPIKSLWCLLENRSYNDMRKLSLNYGGIIKMSFKNKKIKSIKTLFKGDDDFHLD